MSLTVDIWSDVVCPWCYIGKRRFEAALQSFDVPVAIRWRSFQLDPAAGSSSAEGPAYAQRLANKYGLSLARAQGMMEHVASLAGAEGLRFDFGRIQWGNTLDAHRLLHWARVQGAQSELKEAFLAGHFCEGMAPDNEAGLLARVEQVGLDADAAAGVVASGAYTDEVTADLELAARLGISGVPFFRVGRYGVSGAQSSEHLVQVLRTAWSEAEVTLTVPDAEGACTPERCG